VPSVDVLPQVTIAVVDAAIDHSRKPEGRRDDRVLAAGVDHGLAKAV
jgi:hypothetical protein